MSFLGKLRGGQALPPPYPLQSMISASLFGLIAISVVAWLAQASAMPLVLGSFGATCVILGFPDIPFAQPRNVILGHLVSSAVGLACLTVLGSAWWSMALAVALAIFAMQALRVVHPPAGSNPVIVMLAHPGWSFLLFPTLTGAVLLVVVALAYYNLPKSRSFPRYW